MKIIKILEILKNENGEWHSANVLTDTNEVINNYPYHKLKTRLISDYSNLKYNKERKHQIDILKNYNEIVIVDIDGTITELSPERIQYMETKPPNWIKFYSLMEDDNIRLDIIKLINHEFPQVPWVYLTGRPENFRIETVRWLLKYGLPIEPLLMRPFGDKTEDFKYKEYMYRNIIDPLCEVVGIFEDRKSCVEMFNKIGLNVFDVGNHELD